MRARRWSWLWGGALLAAGATSVQGQLQAGPTLLELRGGAEATRLMLSNPGEREVAAQIQIFAWSQVEGEDRLTETEDIGVSPPIVRVPAGGEQLIRLVRLGAPAGGEDRPYRVVVEELPLDDLPATGRVEMRMRYVIPLFDRALGATPPALHCGWDPAATVLQCRNDGGQPAQLGATRLVGADGRETVLSDGLFGYVLPGSMREWVVEDGPDSVPDRLTTHLNGRPLTVPVGGR